MANSPSHKWENGVLVDRAIETNRWKVNETAARSKPKRLKSRRSRRAKAENKSVKAASKK